MKIRYRGWVDISIVLSPTLLVRKRVYLFIYIYIFIFLQNINFLLLLLLLLLLNIRHIIDGYKWQLTLYSQVSDIISYLIDFPIDFQNDLRHIGEHLKATLSTLDGIEDERKKKLDFIFNQLILHSKNTGGQRYDAPTVRDALEIFLRRRNAYKVLRQFLILPCGRTLRSYFGKLGSAGSDGECRAVISNVFSQLDGLNTCCYITADEIYVKPSVSYRAGEIVGLGVDQDPPRPAKTILALMVNFIYSTPAFIARMLPITTLVADFMIEQVELLIKIIHESGGSVFLVMTDNLSVNRKMFDMLKSVHGQASLAAINHPLKNEYFDFLSLFFDPTHMLKNVRNNWVTEKTQTLDFKDPDSGRIVQAKWSDLKKIYNDESQNIIKSTKIDYRTLFPNNFEKQKVSLVLNIFNEKTVVALNLKGCNGTALFVQQITRMWHILNIKSPTEGRNLNDPDRHPIHSSDDDRLIFLEKMATSLKLMDSSKKGKRIRCLTHETSEAWHVSLHGLVGVTKNLLKNGVKYVCPGKVQSDRLEGEFGVIRQSSGGNYLISVEQVLSSLSLRRLKLYHKLEVDPDLLSSAENFCCKGSLEDKDHDLELLDDCFSEASNLTEAEISTLYYISGYVTYKEDLETASGNLADLPPGSEFTNMLSRGKLKHPSSDLYDLSKYLYSFFKTREPKCCTKIFLQGFRLIYQSSGCDYEQSEKILRRFVNTFFKAFAKDQTDKIKKDKEVETKRKRLKLNS